MPHQENGRTVESRTEARAAVTRTGLSTMLVVSTVGVIVLFAIIYFAFFMR
jgi:hypothetical protein